MDYKATIDLIADAQLAVGALGLAWLAFTTFRRIWSRMMSKDPAL